MIPAGDYAQLLFNDRFPSTTHRVTPPPAERSAEGRTSCPMAIYLPEDFVLEPLPECGEAKYAAVDCLTFHTSTNRKYYGEGYRASGADGLRPIFDTPQLQVCNSCSLKKRSAFSGAPARA